MSQPVVLPAFGGCSCGVPPGGSLVAAVLCVPRAQGHSM